MNKWPFFNDAVFSSSDYNGWCKKNGLFIKSNFVRFIELEFFFFFIFFNESTFNLLSNGERITLIDETIEEKQTFLVTMSSSGTAQKRSFRRFQDSKIHL